MASTVYKKKKTITGLVVSDKMDKTVVVAVNTRKRHPVYKKTYKITRKYKANDAKNEAKKGDEVRIEEMRPLSKEKRWKITQIITKSDLEKK